LTRNVGSTVSKSTTNALITPLKGQALSRIKLRGGLSPEKFVQTAVVKKIKADYLHPNASVQDRRRCLKYFVDSLSLAEVNHYAFEGRTRKTKKSTKGGGTPMVSKYDWGEIIKDAKSGVFTQADWGKMATRNWHFEPLDFNDAVTWSMRDENIGYTSYENIGYVEGDADNEEGDDDDDDDV
jgi:hypothetical protein